MQRRNFSLRAFGSEECYRKISPCGGFNSSTSKQTTILRSGSNYTVNPGHMFFFHCLDD